MQLPVALRRPTYRLAYNLLTVYWLAFRPASTGVKCVLTDGDRVLLVRHTYGPPKWELPGGGVKRHEPPQAAARRETAEELGITIDDWTPLGTISGHLRHRQVTLHCFHAEVRAPPLTIDRGEIQAAEWQRRTTLPPKLGDYVSQILSLLQRA
jgi:8-oxo-dGTP pyrophosphatase MutT (NUDIX family)